MYSIILFNVLLNFKPDVWQNFGPQLTYICIWTDTDVLITRAIISASTRIILGSVDWFVWRRGCKAVWDMWEVSVKSKRVTFFLWLSVQIFNIYFLSGETFGVFFVLARCQMSKRFCAVYFCYNISCWHDRYQYFLLCLLEYSILHHRMKLCYIHPFLCFSVRLISRFSNGFVLL